MSIFSIFKNKKEEIALLIDIGNGSIQAGIISILPNTPPEFLSVAKSPYTIVDKPESKKLSQDMGLVLDRTLKDLMKQSSRTHLWKRKTISGVLVTFSSPWFVLKTKEAHVSEGEQFTVTSSLINDLVKKEEEAFKKELLQDFSKVPEDFFDIIEKNAIYVKVNGYHVDDILGQKTKVIDVFMCMSAIPKKIKEKVEELVLKHTHTSEEISMHTFPLVLFSAIRDNFADESDFMIMDITSEVTDVVLVQRDYVVGCTSFPIGRNSVIRRIAKSFGSTLEIAESTFHMYLSKKAEDRVLDAVDKLLIDIESEWSVYFENVLLELSPSMVLPKKVYVTVDTDVATIFNDFLKTSKTDSTALFRRNALVVHVNTELLAPFYKSNPNLHVDEFTAIPAIFYNKIIQN